MQTNSVQPAIAALVSSAIAFKAYRRKSLNPSGAFLGFIVMSIHIAVNYRFGAMLLVFFFTSSKLTKIGQEKKRGVDADFKEGGQRNWIQVLSNSGIATILAMIVWKLSGSQDKCLDSKESGLITALIGGMIGHYSCCNGDTWSSELGVLSDAQPRLITTLKPVRRGTNGGVTKSGLLAATAAGSIIGLTFVILGFFTTRCTFDVALKQLLVIPLSALAGLGGSVIDSLLGATLQFSGFCSVRNKVVGKSGPTVKKISGVDILDNNAVNLVSILLTTPVRRGTNGGVTKSGLLAAIAAGSIIGLTFVILGFFTTRCTFDVTLKQLLVLPLSALAGLGGSVIDSLLGATLQFSGFCSVRNKVVGKSGPTVKKISGVDILDNNAVNIVSILLTTVLTSIACLYIF